MAGALAFLAPSRTAGYVRSTTNAGALNAFTTGQPGWLTYYMIEEMRWDPQCNFGLRILMAPLFTLEWEVEAEKPEVAKYVDDTLRRIWKQIAVFRHLLEFGHLPCEVNWREQDGLIHFDSLQEFYPFDARPLQHGGKLAGIQVNMQNKDGPVRLGPPRSFWAVNEAEFGGWFGRSRYSGARLPWTEKSGRHGALDIRRGWGVKCSFDGGVLYYPPGVTIMEDGSRQDNQSIAREILEKKEGGGILTLPNARDPDSGEFLWKYEPPKINGSFADLLQYPKDLDMEVLKGMGIPPEVVAAAESGSGWSGRSVPFLVFLTSEDQIADAIIAAVDEQIISHGVCVNFGPCRYKIKPKPLADLAKAPPQPTPDAVKPAEQPGAPKPYIGPKNDTTYGLSLDDEPPILDVPDVRQFFNYDCGAACTHALSLFFGVDRGCSEEEFIRALGTTPADGTRPERIVEFFREAGLEVSAGEQRSLTELRGACEQGRPTIVPVQDYGTKAEYRENQSGHYVIVVGFVGEYVVIQDPSSANAEAGGGPAKAQPDSIQDFGKLLVRRSVLEEVWHDLDQAGNVLTRYGITVGKPAELSFDPTVGESDRSARESAVAGVDDLIDTGSTAGLTIAAEIRRKVAGLLKKKFPERN